MKTQITRLSFYNQTKKCRVVSCADDSALFCEYIVLLQSL